MNCKNINQVIQEFNLPPLIYMNIWDRSEDHNVLIKGLDENHKTYLVKIQRDEFANPSSLQIQGELSNLLYENELPFAKRFKTKTGHYYTLTPYEEKKEFVTVEEYIFGAEPTSLYLSLLSQIGELLVRCIE